ncbi:MAG: cupin domain-containing protein [Myxococcota bacterium]
MTLALASILGLVAAAAAGEGSPPAPPAPAEAATPVADPRWVASSIQWAKPFGPDGPEMAYVHGDPKSGPFQMFLRMPAGAIAGWHTHDSDYTAVVVQGTWQHLVQGETTAVNLPPGSFWSQAGKANHDDRCIEGTCVIFIDSAGPQTYTPKMPDGSDPPPPPPPAPPPDEGKKKKKK